MKKILYSFLLPAFLWSCGNESQPTVSSDQGPVEIEFSKDGELEFLNQEGEVLKKIEIEIADNVNKRARGLMDRSQMDEDKGMIFIFDDDEVARHTFYMKNTRIPLDIMYFNKDSVLINYAHNAQPGADSEVQGGTVEAAAEDSKFVVEINGGLAEKWGIKEGETKIRWIQK